MPGFARLSEVLGHGRGVILHPPFPTLAGENISARFVVPTVATSVDLVLFRGETDCWLT